MTSSGSRFRTRKIGGLSTFKFRSGRCPIDLEAGVHILFSLGVLLSRKGKDALVFALVSKKQELLDFLARHPTSQPLPAANKRLKH